MNLAITLRLQKKEYISIKFINKNLHDIYARVTEFAAEEGK